MRSLFTLLTCLLLLTNCKKDTVDAQLQYQLPATTLQKLQAIVKASSNLEIDLYQFSNSTPLGTITVKGGDITGIFSDNFIVVQKQGTFYYNVDRIIEIIPISDVNHSGYYSQLYLYF